MSMFFRLLQKQAVARAGVVAPKLQITACLGISFAASAVPFDITHSYYRQKSLVLLVANPAASLSRKPSKGVRIRMIPPKKMMKNFFHVCRPRVNVSCLPSSVLQSPSKRPKKKMKADVKHVGSSCVWSDTNSTMFFTTNWGKFIWRNWGKK